MAMSKSHASLMTFRHVPRALPCGKAAFTPEVSITWCLPVGPFINQKTTLKKCSSPSSMRAIPAQSFFSTENNCRTHFLQIQILFYKYQFA